MTVRNRPTLRLLALLAALTLTTTACIDELGEFLEFLSFDLSEDPVVQRRAQNYRSYQDFQESRRLDQRYIETGDISALEASMEVYPEGEDALALLVQHSRLGGDAEAIRDAEQRLARAVSRRNVRLGTPRQALTAAAVRNESNQAILFAQISLLGHVGEMNWDPPAPDATQATKDLFADFCTTRAQLRADNAGKSLSEYSFWQDGPDCP